MIIEPRVRGFICMTAHPDGCAANVGEQIAHVRERGPIDGPRSVLVVGASTGYGLASRIVAAFGCGARTVGAFFERPGSGRRPASAGWYNTAAFERAAADAGIGAWSYNGDAFADEAKERVLDLVRTHLDGSVDLVVYSLASPRRVHPESGETFNSVIKPIGEPFAGKTIDARSGALGDASIEPATDQEVEDTVAVMGGDDWRRWIDALDAAGALAPRCRTLAYTYLGPEHTWPIYRDGTIGKAKENLQRTADELDARLRPGGGRALLSVNRALVTQASAAIPTVAVYLAMLAPLLRERGTDEGCIEQIDRLFRERLCAGEDIPVDEAGRVRLDDYEMANAVQAAVRERWEQVTEQDFRQILDVEGYQREFLRLFGFGMPGIDYGADVDPAVAIPSIDG
ncbi:MAG: trans-2-enoyl-CoA reductase family protein [Spirochaetaceae bacterium]|nr:trans-2-enoyl-CoA reductase family protein [Spirochaetaceae bacterium]